MNRTKPLTTPTDDRNPDRDVVASIAHVFSLEGTQLSNRDFLHHTQLYCNMFTCPQLANHARKVFGQTTIDGKENCSSHFPTISYSR